MLHLPPVFFLIQNCQQMTIFLFWKSLTLLPLFFPFSPWIQNFLGCNFNSFPHFFCSDSLLELKSHAICLRPRFPLHFVKHLTGERSVYAAFLHNNFILIDSSLSSVDQVTFFLVSYLFFFFLFLFFKHLHLHAELLVLFSHCQQYPW